MSIGDQVRRGLVRPQGEILERTGTASATIGAAVTVPIPLTDHVGGRVAPALVVVIPRGNGNVWEDRAARTATTVSIVASVASLPFVVYFG